MRAIALFGLSGFCAIGGFCAFQHDIELKAQIAKLKAKNTELMENGWRLYTLVAAGGPAWTRSADQARYSQQVAQETLSESRHSRELAEQALEAQERIARTQEDIAIELQARK
jgi:hypothetical protein